MRALFVVLMGLLAASVPARGVVVLPVFQKSWGTPGAGPGQFSTPLSIAVGPDASVYVADTGNYRIQKFTADGVFLRQWGSTGSGPGQFQGVYGVCVDAQGFVYATDRYNYRVQKFTSDGEFVRAWGEAGFGPGQFAWYPQPSTFSGGPRDIAAAPDGSIYVTDPGGYRVERFTPDGVYLGSISGAVQGYVDDPSGVGFDRYGHVFVCDPSLNHVIKFTSSWLFVSQWGSYPVFRGSWDIEVDEDGNVWVMDTGNSNIHIYDNNGTLLAHLYGGRGSGDGQFTSQAFALSENGTVYVADMVGNRIEKFVGPTAVEATTWGAIKDMFRRLR